MTWISLKQSYTSARWNVEFTPSTLCVCLLLFTLFLSPLESSRPCCLHARTEWSVGEQIACDFAHVFICVCARQRVSVLFRHQHLVCVPSCRLCFYGRASLACRSTWGLRPVRGDSWHGFGYMCFWTDKLSYVSNVSAPPRLQAAPHIWQIT